MFECLGLVGEASEAVSKNEEFSLESPKQYVHLNDHATRRHMLGFIL